MAVIRPVLNYPQGISYSEKFAGNDGFEYRFVTLPKNVYLVYRKMVVDKQQQGVSPLMNEAEWRGLGITMSMGWIHHMIWRREPNILCFRRPLIVATHTQAVQPPVLL
eukprot:Protomagalhaensia_wolfi_Nauph_80__1913@NODE_21_length_4819_cov_15_300837_g16_i0_p6_GENE_NODE_21_length_4819_cov_15_300837_g16_i0NODE_21_length_4819_cov_15_300837_g16_i0_p6_ORF_typecomplete_len108_score18_78CKS/PF01111_19/1_1e22_NODE_21_length_4819_cov_15_300837_g16_i0267590